MPTEPTPTELTAEQKRRLRESLEACMCETCSRILGAGRKIDEPVIAAAIRLGS